MSFLADWPYFYPLLVVAAFGCLGLGRLLLHGAPLWRQFLAGLLILSAIDASLAWVAPLAVLPLNRAAILAGWLVLLRDARRNGWTAAWRPSGRELVCGLLASVIGLGFSLPLHFHFIALGESPYFLSHVVEFFKADYFGPIRMAGYYPWEVSAIHILPSMVLTTLASLLPKGTMLQAVEIRFLLVFLAFARFSYLAMVRSPLSPAWSGILIAAGLLIIRHELNSVNYSTYLYIILMLELGVVIFWDRDVPEKAARDLLVLLAAMVAAKTSIFYLSGLVFLWVALRFPHQALRPVPILAGLVTVFQIVTVMSRPKPFPDVSYKLTLANPLGGRASLDYYPNAGDALINNETVSLLFQQDYAVGIFAILALVAVKYALVPLRVADRMIVADPGRREVYRVAEVMLLIMAAGWILLRHDQHGISHQVWVTFGSAPMVLAAVLVPALASDGWKWRLGMLAVAGAIMAVGYNPWPSITGPEPIRIGGLAPAELARMSSAEPLVRRSDETDEAYCERALLLGHRVAAGSVPISCIGSAGTFAVNPDSRR
jgi:hypothetical protein